MSETITQEDIRAMLQKAAADNKPIIISVEIDSEGGNQERGDDE